VDTPPVPLPLVSVIVPARDRAALLARCAHGVLHGTDYPAIELLVLDNGSRTVRMRRLLRRLGQDRRVRVLDAPGPFNWSALNNAGVRAARGEIVVLLNSDTAVADPGWLRHLVVQALRPGVGAVGAKLLYPNGTVQHAGISLGPGAQAVHLMRHARADDPAHRGLLARTRSVAAVTGACLAMRRSLFLGVGGLDETLPVTGSDVDLCLRLRSLGYRVVWRADAVLFHHESATRGLDATAAARTRIAAERLYLLRRWGMLAEHDPCLGPNLTVVGDRLALTGSVATSLRPRALQPVMAA
jgi:GT2 family glycosyltransferase